MHSRHLFGPFHPFSNAEGRVAYWLIIGLLLLVVCAGALFFYRTSGFTDKELRSIIALDRKEASSPPQRYKIATPTGSLERGGPGAPSGTVASEGVRDESGMPPEKKTDAVGPASPTRIAGRQDDDFPPQTGKGPVGEVQKEGTLATQRHADPELEADKGPVPEGTVASPDLAKKGKASSQKNETVSLTKEGREGGRRFFVRVPVGNVREGPSLASGVKFRIENGCSLTVTGKEDGWYAVQMDDGRSGWAYHTLLADSLVPRRENGTQGQAVRKIESIHPEAPIDNTAKVVFRLSGSPAPEVTMIEEGRPRVVCDFLDANIAPVMGRRIEVGNGIIETIRIGLHKWPQQKVRVVLDLVPEQSYQLETSFVDKEKGYVLAIKTE
ncbi:MAG: AMIN domain-containing protein [Deltaproteobacteria bacterium]|nr:AMIN domain-containing protein [Deltaproteobacteria bacterium]